MLAFPALLAACPSPDCPVGKRFEHGACVAVPAPPPTALDTGTPDPTDPTPDPTGDTGPPPTYGTPFSGAAMYRADPQRTGAFPGRAPERGEVASVAPTGAACATPSISDGLAVAAAGLDLVAVDVASGAVEWTFRSGGSFQTTPAIADGTVFAGDRLGGVHAIGLRDGAARWQASGPAACGPAAVDGDEVWIVCGDLLRFDAADGDVLGSAPLARPDPNQGVTLTEALAVVGSGPLQAFDRATLDEAWRADLGTTRSTAATDGVLLWLETSDGIYALGTNLGAVVWATDAFTSLSETSPALADGIVYTATTRAVRARDAATGDERWSALLPERPSGGVAVAADAVFVTDEGGTVHAIGRADGAVRWSLAADACTAPALADGWLAVGTPTGVALVH